MMPRSFGSRKRLKACGMPAAINLSSLPTNPTLNKVALRNPLLGGAKIFNEECMMTFDQNTIAVTENTVTITNEYRSVQYPIRQVEDLGLRDRIVGLDALPYRQWNLFFLYNEAKREHFFIDRDAYRAWKLQREAC